MKGKKKMKDISPLASAMLEDEAVRLQSQKRSKEYLENIDDVYDSTPFWMWCIFYFALGMLFTITVDTVTYGTSIHEVLKWLKEFT